MTYRVPHNAAVQIYDYKEKTARIQYGPDLVMLGPDEHFTQLSLSGGKPKRPNQIKSLCLLLGPDFCTDIIVVETSDHARLSLQVSYNWHFKVRIFILLIFIKPFDSPYLKFTRVLGFDTNIYRLSDISHVPRIYFLSWCYMLQMHQYLYHSFS